MGVTLAFACDRVPESMREAGDSGVGPSASQATRGGPGRRIEWMIAPPGTSDLPAAVRAESARAKSAGRTLLVYVGATWCEPCKRFHEAVDQGLLDSAFPHLSVLAFDHDHDENALRTAGYVSQLIPLFAVPGEDGRASGKQIEGSIKGPGAVDQITPRLRELIGG